MSHRFKNLLIAFLLLVIAALSVMLYLQSYGRYCQPIIKEMKSAPEAHSSVGE